MKFRILITLMLLLFFCVITNYSQVEKQSAIAILFDNTGSMRLELDNIKNLGTGIVQNLEKNSEVKVFSFETIESEKLTVKITSGLDWTQDKTKIYSAIDKLGIVRGRTTLYDAILSALKELVEKVESEKNSFSNKILILVTDGEDRSSENKREDIINYLKENNVKIYIFGFLENSRSPKKAKRNLTEFAEESSGKVIFPERKQKIRDLIKNILPFKLDFGGKGCLKSRTQRFRILL